MKHKFLLIFVLSLIISCVLSMMPVWGQTNVTAAISLDGRQLFKVTQLDGFEAQQRADDANQILNRVVQSGEPVQVKVVKINDLPVIQVNRTNLLTVTQKDTPEGMMKEEQAQRWRDRIYFALQQAQEQRSPEYIRKALLISVACVLVAIALSSTISSIWDRWLHRLIPQRETSASAPSIELFLKFTLNLARIGLWMGTALYISNEFPQTREVSYKITNFLVFSIASPLIPLGDKYYSVIQIIILLAMFVGLVIAAKSCKTILRSRILSVTGINRGAQETIAVIANYTIIFIGTIVLLQIWGLDLSSITIFAGVLGVGIGLGLQGIAKEFVSGLVIVFERPIQVGDFVNIGELMGTVERISVRSTEIRTLDQVSIIVPNSSFLEKEIINWSHGSIRTRIRLPVGVAYGSDLNKVQQALIDATKDYADLVQEPPPQVFFKGYGINALNLELLVWILEPRKQFRIKSDLYFRIDAIFRERKIEIPFPQQDLHLRSGSLPIELSPPLVDLLAKLLKNSEKNAGNKEE